MKFIFSYISWIDVVGQICADSSLISVVEVDDDEDDEEDQANETVGAEHFYCAWKEKDFRFIKQFLILREFINFSLIIVFSYANVVFNHLIKISLNENIQTSESLKFYL